MHVHLDAVGGVAGDMFAAALVDAGPEHEAAVREAVTALGLGDQVTITFENHNDGVLRGRRLRVDCPDPPHSTRASVVRETIDQATLAAPVRDRALAMLDLLAGAEAEVHGIPVDKVAFHELGGLDTPVDLVAAATLIEAVGPATWSCGSLPRGRGTVKTAHGMLPVPAPATALLLEGMVLVDDGIEGERITPTGAAILRHLAPGQGPDAAPRRLGAIGHGFGTRRLEGRSNVLRAQFYDEGNAGMAAGQVAVICFEVDDQTAEDLAVGLDRLRASEGVLDVSQHAVTGKGGRITSRIQVLARPEQVEAAAARCFAETTTIGLRWSLADRLVLGRDMVTVDSEEGPVRVKIVQRPGGERTAKADIADLGDGPAGRAERQELRRAAERSALAKHSRDDGGDEGEDGNR